jgi:hypothetical protein
MGVMHLLGVIPSPGSVADNHSLISTKPAILQEWHFYTQSLEEDINENSQIRPHLLM